MAQPCSGPVPTCLRLLLSAPHPLSSSSQLRSPLSYLSQKTLGPDVHQDVQEGTETIGQVRGLPVTPLMIHLIGRSSRLTRQA